EGGVEVHQVQPLGPGLLPGERGGERVAVRRLGAGLAMNEPDGLAVADVDGGEEFERGHQGGGLCEGGAGADVRAGSGGETGPDGFRVLGPARSRTSRASWPVDARRRRRISPGGTAWPTGRRSPPRPRTARRGWPRRPWARGSG